MLGTIQLSWHLLQEMMPFVVARWRAVVEIVILAVGLYYALRFIRGTRGATA